MVSAADGSAGGRILYAAPAESAAGAIALAVLNDAAIEAGARLSVEGVDISLCD